MPRASPFLICIVSSPPLRQRQRGIMRLTNERATQRHWKVGSHEEAMRRLQRERRHDLATELASDCVEEGGDGGGAQGEEETVEEQVVD